MPQTKPSDTLRLRSGEVQALVQLGGWNRDTLYHMGVCRLFSCESSGVYALVVGPRVGYDWKQVYYYRWMAVENRVNQFVPVLPNRESDQKLLRACVNKVNKWLDQTAVS